VGETRYTCPLWNLVGLEVRPEPANRRQIPLKLVHGACQVLESEWTRPETRERNGTEGRERVRDGSLGVCIHRRSSAQTPFPNKN
jgi:hypothetical protein